MSSGLQQHSITKDHTLTVLWPTCKRSMALDIVHSKLHATIITEPMLCMLSWKAGEKDHGQRRYHHFQGIRSAAIRHPGSLYRPQAPAAASPAGPGIAVVP